MLSPPAEADCEGITDQTSPPPPCPTSRPLDLPRSLSSLKISDAPDKNEITILNLPSEIRNEIYRLALGDHFSNLVWDRENDKFVAPSHIWLHDPIQQPVFTLTNRQFQQEGLSLMFDYSMPCFIALNHGSSRRRPIHPSNKRWMERAGKNSVHISHIVLVVTIKVKHDNSEGRTGEGDTEEALDGNEQESTITFDIIVRAMKDDERHQNLIYCLPGFPHHNPQPLFSDPKVKAARAMVAKIQCILDGPVSSNGHVPGTTLAEIEMIRQFLEAREDVVDVPRRL